jgi:hypothetical protein
MSLRKNIHPYLSDDLYARFKQFVTANGTTDSSVAETALAEYLDQTSHKKILLKRLNALGRQQERLERDVAIVMEMLGAFVNIWMIHNPRVADGQEATQKKMAAPRFAAFQKFVAKQLGAGGRRIINDLVDEPAVPPPGPDA